MKKTILCCLFIGMICAKISAQEDANNVSISAIQPTYENIPEEARNNLETKMQRIISECGLGSSDADRFIMTSRVDVIERKINSAGMIIQRMEITFIIGDIIEEKRYGTSTISAMGIGETDDKCFIKAFQSIKPNNLTLVAFVNKAKDDIVAYYTNNCSFILQESERLAGTQKYNEAIATLVAIPKVCSACYTACQSKAMEIYQMQIDQEGRVLIQQATAAWNVKKNYDCAEKALEILSKVNPSSSSIDEANQFIQTINEKLRKDEAAEAARRKAEWDFKVKQYEDKYALEVQKQADKAAILNTFANRFGKIEIGIKKEKAFKLGSSSK